MESVQEIPNYRAILLHELSQDAINPKKRITAEKCVLGIINMGISPKAAICSRYDLFKVYLWANMVHKKEATFQHAPAVPNKFHEIPK